MIYLHKILAGIALLFFVYQCYVALFKDKVQPKLTTIFAHSVYLLMIISGIVMTLPLMQAENSQTHWVFAKAVLLVAVMSASVKAFRRAKNGTERKVGVFVATIGLIGILILAFIQPANFF
ncbi:SirB2 family protein [Psychrobacter sp. HD31]|uniref:SirB2 family protein n=1 Tax=Psychrobacter sp. HD31 TaxID=3112003 RepID=UPI003DA6BE63